jgi:hypothetical protein
LIKEKQTIDCKLNLNGRAINSAKELFEEKCKKIEAEKKEVKLLNERLSVAEKELALKDAEYDKQIALQTNGNQIENLPVKHSQKVQELDSLQNTFIELENKVDEVHSKQIQKITEV